MTKTDSDSISRGFDIAFWFAVLSPIIGLLLGLLAPFLIYH